MSRQVRRSHRMTQPSRISLTIAPWSRLVLQMIPREASKPLKRGTLDVPAHAGVAKDCHARILCYGFACLQDASRLGQTLTLAAATEPT